MGYTVKIGELKVEVEMDGLDSYIDFDVEDQEGRKEPFLNAGDLGDGSNSRFPSYGNWKAVCEKAGMLDFMFGAHVGVMRSHPGQVPLSTEHKDLINKIYKNFREEYPDAHPHYDGDDACAAMVRLEWVRYWVNWAVDNCEKPVFCNW